MKKLALALFAAGLMTAPAMANDDVVAHCEAYAEANGADNSGCSCLGDAADADASVADAILAIQTEEDVASAPEAALAAIAACFPDAG